MRICVSLSNCVTRIIIVLVDLHEYEGGEADFIRLC